MLEAAVFIILNNADALVRTNGILMILLFLPPVGLKMSSSGLHYRRSHSFSKQTLLHLGSMNILCKLSTENHQCPKEILR